MTVLIVIVILVVLIVVHEFGHFTAAKIFGVKVEEFGVGYPPRAFLFGKLGGTEYTLNWVPFGGFVRLYGDEGQEQHGRGSFVDAPYWKQAVILAAGVAMNAIAAYILFAAALHTGVPQAVSAPPAGESAHLYVTGVVPASPAFAAGIQPGDEIVGVKDASGVSPSALTPDAMVAFVSGHGGKPVTLEYVRAGTTADVSVIPANAVIPGAAGQPALGVQLALVATVAEPWRAALVDSLYETRNSFVLVGQELGGLIAGLFRGSPDLSGVVGPVGIVSYVGQAEQSGAGAVVLLAALISVNLAIINLLPIPVLDGGRLVVLAAEAIMRRRAPQLAVQTLNAIGISLIILLMVVVTYHDIAHLFA